jgi:3-dehydroquinate dehydratase I
MRKKKSRIPLTQANLVGVIHTPAGFKLALRAAVEALEVRVDTLPRPPLPEEIAVLPQSVILTIRSFSEGGARPLTDATRLALYLELLPAANAVDIELRSVSALKEAVDAALASKKTVILSFHDFQGTPSQARLRTLVARARDKGADIIKIATKTTTPADIARLLNLQAATESPLAVMGMGPLGRAARLLFACSGSTLNYGWIDKPLVPGQWSAREFRDLLIRVRADA